MTTLKPNPHRPSNYNRSIGKQIREVLSRQGLSSRDLSMKSGIRMDHLVLYEGGLRPPTCRALQQIAQALGIPADVLLPEATLDEPINQKLYRGFRQAWFLPAPDRMFLASILEYLLDRPGFFLAARLSSTGVAHAPRA